MMNELRSVELRLSAKLEELGVLINEKNRLIATEQDGSGSTSSLLKALAVQLILEPETVSEFRNSILSKCFQKSSTKEVSKTPEEVDEHVAEIKEEVESLPDQDDDEEEEHEQLSSEYDCTESEGSSGNRSRAGTPLHVKSEVDSEDDVHITEPGGNETGNVKNEKSWDVDHTDHSASDEEDETTSISEKNESSFEMETDEEEDFAYFPSQTRRSSPRKTRSQRESNNEDFTSIHNMFACEANGCRLYFDNITELNTHLETHSTTIHSCSECSRGFLNPDLLKLHKLLHSKRVRGYCSRYPCPSPSCSSTFWKTKELESHYNLNHGLGLGCYKCPKCELNLATERALTFHLKKHKEATDPSQPISEPLHCIAPPPCSICGLQFLHLVNLDVHRKKVHNLGVECPTCNKLFSNRASLRRHKSQYHIPNAEAHICPFCGISVKTKDYLQEHIVCVHPEQYHRKEIYHCSHCLKGFHRKHLLGDHLPKCVNNPNAVKVARHKAKTTQPRKDLRKITPCDVCGTLVKGSKNNMRRHLLIHQRKPTKPCKKCRLVVEESSFRQHMETHENSEPEVKAEDKKEVSEAAPKKRKRKIKNETKTNSSVPTQKECLICDTCGKQFHNRKILTRHINQYHKIDHAKPFQCHICGSSLSTKNSLTCHLQIVHTNEKRFACHLCPYKTKVKSCLQSHLRRRHGKVKGQEFAPDDDDAPKWKKRKCNYPSCNQEFGEENELKLHVEREHQAQHDEKGTSDCMCSLCGRIFANHQRLIRHNEVHTQEKRYKCPICQKPLSQPNSVKEHVSSVHGVGREKEYLSCTQPNCDFKTKHRSHLFKHLRDIHGIYTGKPRQKS